MVSHNCLLVELGPICNSMAASLCLMSCEDHSLLIIYNGGLWKTITGLGPLDERSGSVVECLTRDRRVAGSSLTGVTALWSLSKTHLS